MKHRDEQGRILCEEPDCYRVAGRRQLCGFEFCEYHYDENIKKGVSRLVVLYRLLYPWRFEEA